MQEPGICVQQKDVAKQIQRSCQNGGLLGVLVHVKVLWHLDQRPALGSVSCKLVGGKAHTERAKYKPSQQPAMCSSAV